jgi:lysyl-tRNA synthetase class 2
MSELDEQIRHRREKRDVLVEAGIQPYPTRFDYDLEPAEVRERWGETTAEELEEESVRLRVPGRITAVRRHGKLVFADLSDGRETIQLFIRGNRLSDRGKTLLEHLDLGDIVGAEGTLMRTRMGELSLMTDELTLLSKALRPLPEKWHGLTDVEARYRQRYLDLVANPEVRRTFETRAAIIRGIRTFLDDKGFLEVETPMMQSIPGGATARPFRTHLNALDLDLYLRIAPELFLKRLLVGGIPKVYEINRNFRNEGISFKHNPEFTMLELYWAYADYRDLMDLTEELLPQLAREALGTATLRWHDEEIDLTPPWPRLTMRGALAELGGVDEDTTDTAEGLLAEIERRGLEPPADASYGKLLAHLFDELVESRLRQPTFLLDHPVEVSPLAKQSPEDPRFTERFELYIGGMEIANAFSELNDPDVQAERFRQQIAAREAGDEEAHLFDADYVRALEHGMPPAGGEGIGIDRLVMLFTGMSSIRDVILFPLLRPEEPAP